jgi:hypothetical protein
MRIFSKVYWSIDNDKPYSFIHIDLLFLTVAFPDSLSSFPFNLLVIVGILAIVDGRIDGDCPHAGRISITVAIVVLAAIAAGPDENGSQPVSALIHAFHNCPANFRKTFRKLFPVR